MDEYTENLDVEVNIPDSVPFEEETELEEKETPVESSPTEQPDEETETTEEVEETIVDDNAPEKIEPKPVEGETPKERALRKEIERLRGKVREEKVNELFVPKNEPTIEDDSLEEYDPEEIKKLDKILKARGYVKKAELERSTWESDSKKELDNFLKSHPEYLPQNDKDDALWNQFKQEFSIYGPARNTEQYRDFLERTHKSIIGDKVINRDVTAAASEKLKVASHGSATVNKPKSPPKTSSIPEDMKIHMKGFTEAELAEM